MARYEKKESGNPKGRPKGAVNKMPAVVKELYAKIIEGYTEEEVTEDFKALEAKERLDILIKLGSHFVPKAPTNVTLEDKRSTIESILKKQAGLEE